MHRQPKIKNKLIILFVVVTSVFKVIWLVTYYLSYIKTSWLKTVITGYYLLCSLWVSCPDGTLCRWLVCFSLCLGPLLGDSRWGRRHPEGRSLTWQLMLAVSWRPRWGYQLKPIYMTSLCGLSFFTMLWYLSRTIFLRERERMCVCVCVRICVCVR